MKKAAGRGCIVSVATNGMEALADVATRVVMMVTQGILTTAVVVLMICAFDLRIGGIAALGAALFFAVNSRLQKKAKALAPVKDASDRALVEQVPEYIRGMAEFKAYSLTGEKSAALNRAIDENTATNIHTEPTFVPVMLLQSLTAAIEALTKEKTILMIAHRLKTVRHADNILVLDGGKIARSGTHDELMRQGGLYRRFVESRELAVGWRV